MSLKAPSPANRCATRTPSRPESTANGPAGASKPAERPVSFGGSPAASNRATQLRLHGYPRTVLMDIGVRCSQTERLSAKNSRRSGRPLASEAAGVHVAMPPMPDRAGRWSPGRALSRPPCAGRIGSFTGGWETLGPEDGTEWALHDGCGRRRGLAVRPDSTPARCTCRWRSRGPVGEQDVVAPDVQRPGYPPSSHGGFRVEPPTPATAAPRPRSRPRAGRVRLPVRSRCVRSRRA